MPAGRFAPSPTGRLHLGNLRTALLAWLYARYDGSPFQLRFEDLDQASIRDEHYASQLADLAALGLEWDEPVTRQSADTGPYHRALAELDQDDLLYPCFCSRREIREAASAPNREHSGHHYPGTCADLSSAQRSERALVRPAALRIRAEGLVRAVDDELVGPVSVQLDDFVLRRNDGTPAYHLAVSVDDAAAGIELVVRGDDLAESACRQRLIYEYLDLQPLAQYAHVPLMLSPEGERLAKRHGAVDLDDRRRRGEQPTDVLGYLASTLGLAERGEAVTTTTLLDRFDREAMAAKGPWPPTVLSAEFLA